MEILRTSFSLSSPNPNPKPFPSLSSSNAISPLSLLPKLSSLSLTHRRSPPSTIIRMGGGPRTYPGGVSKWQWKRMQAKKAKQLLKARLARERQIYEMRKRAELKAAVSNLERPWEVVEKGAPKSSSSLFSVSADEQLKVLADRFQKPGGFDLWSDNDGPQLFHTPQGLPSARFFPKGVVHSIKPYGPIDEEVDSSSNPNPRPNQRIDGKRGKNLDGKAANGGNLRQGRKTGSNNATSDDRSNKWNGRRRNYGKSRDLHDEDVYDMSLQGDGSYGFSEIKDYDDDKLKFSSKIVKQNIS